MTTRAARMRTRPKSLLRRGFTLIELLAVILIISILVATLVPMVTDAIAASRVTGCSENMRKIYDALNLYYLKYKAIPTGSGVDFFASVISREAIENTKTNAERLTCPAVDKSALAIGAIPWEEWWTDLDRVDGTYSAYAGRDTKNHPLRTWPPSGKEPLIADDNDGGANHGTTTNVLYGDGSVHTFELVELKEQGVVQKEETPAARRPRLAGRGPAEVHARLSGRAGVPSPR